MLRSLIYTQAARMQVWVAQIRRDGHLTVIAVATMLLINISCCGALLGAASSGGKVTLDAIMPPYETAQEDEYLCTAVQLPDEPMKLVSIESLSEQGTVHHMLLFGKRQKNQTSSWYL